MDTIFALATAAGRAGVAIVRVSGPGAFDAVARLAGGVPPARQARLCRLTGRDGPLDSGLVLCFPGPGSFTGEDVAEFQVHGSPAGITALLNELAEMPGLRMAEAGEFTRRALMNGRLDLVEVEALADLLAAETEVQRRQAVALMSGELRALADRWRERLVRSAALQELMIDFSDEDVAGDFAQDVAAIIGALIPELRHEVKGFGAAERIRDGFVVAIVGRPNAGKSTLLNALAGREAAITSTIAGTTRDVIEVRLDLDGLAVTVLDTAGLRESEDTLENAGIAKAIARGNEADLRVFLLDGEGAVPLLEPQSGDLCVRGKIDLAQGDQADGVSGLTGAGVGRLVSEIGARLRERVAGAATINRRRHLVGIETALASLEAAADELAIGSARVEVVAEEIRRAIHALDRIVGRVDVETVLGEIFASFCVGK